jgi:hypothetical protein
VGFHRRFQETTEPDASIPGGFKDLHDLCHQLGAVSKLARDADLLGVSGAA